jgi:hypothetical protein
MADFGDEIVLTKWLRDAAKAGVSLTIKTVGHQPHLFGAPPKQMLSIVNLKGEMMMVSESTLENARAMARELSK